MPYQLPFGGLSAALALAIRVGQWVGGLLIVLGAALVAVARRLKR